MKENKKHIEDFEELINQSWVNSYEPSDSFVDEVMRKVAKTDMITPAGKYLKIMFKVAAASAIIMFITNLFILVSSTQNSNTSESDWTTVYELDSKANWYEYYSDDTFIANNQTFN